MRRPREGPVGPGGHAGPPLRTVRHTADNASRRGIRVLRAFGLTDKGRIRPINEDCFAIHEDLGLLVVADGMGGHNAGEVAAQLAVDAVIEVVRDHDTNARLKGSRSSRTVERWSANVEDNRSASLSGERDPFPFGYDPSLSDDGNLLRTAIHVACVQVIEAAG